VTRLRAAQEQHRQLAVHIERLIGRIATLEQLIQENPEAPTEGRGEEGGPPRL
jgi:hypothetical protein